MAKEPAPHHFAAILVAGVVDDGPRSNGLLARSGALAMRAWFSCVLIVIWFFSAAGCTDVSTPPDLSFTEYTIISGDKLQVTVLGQPAMTGEWIVDASGIVWIPGLRSIQTSGLTTGGLEKKISQALAAKGVAAAVNVKNLTVQQSTYDSFFVRGEVVAPGQFPFVEGMTIFSAVTKAGGFTNRANIDRFTIVRRIGNKVIEGRATGNTLVRPGDVITVLARQPNTPITPGDVIAVMVGTAAQ